MPAAPDTAKTEEWLVQEWANQLTQVIESMTGEQPVSKVQRASPFTGSEVFWWEQHFSITQQAGIWMGATAQSWKEIGSRVLTAAGVEDGKDTDFKGTYQEVLNQSLSSLAQSFSGRLKKEVSCSSGKEGAPEREGYPTFLISLLFGPRKPH